MKTLLNLAFIAISISGFCQDYEPFDQNVPKRFNDINNPAEADYFFYALDSQVSNDTTYFSQYIKKDFTNIVPIGNCPSWGGTDGAGSDTTWLGRTISYNETSQTLILENYNNDSLRFNFNLALGDSAVFYQNANYSFYIEHTSVGQETIFSQIDTVKRFEIQCYDNLLQPANSSLNGFEIAVGKNLGMIDFINAFNFPIAEQTLTLRGQLHPTIGNYQLTYDASFPWDTGDLIEYQYTSGDPSTTSNSHYLMMEITNRVETTDSVKIYFQPTILNTSSGSAYTGPALFEYDNPIIFAKGDNIVEAPHNQMPTDKEGYSEQLVDFCGMKSQMNTTSNFTQYCEECECMVPFDGFGQFKLNNFKYVENQGMILESLTQYGPLQQAKFSIVNQVYSKINGVECGSIVYLNTEELQFTFDSSPNPASDYINVSVENKAQSIELVNSLGQVVYSSSKAQTEYQIDVKSFNSGLYILKVKSEGKLAQKKIVIN